MPMNKGRILDELGRARYHADRAQRQIDSQKRLVKLARESRTLEDAKVALEAFERMQDARLGYIDRLLDQLDKLP